MTVHNFCIRRILLLVRSTGGRTLPWLVRHQRKREKSDAERLRISIFQAPERRRLTRTYINIWICTIQLKAGFVSDLTFLPQLHQDCVRIYFFQKLVTVTQLPTRKVLRERDPRI